MRPPAPRLGKAKLPLPTITGRAALKATGSTVDMRPEDPPGTVTLTPLPPLALPLHLKKGG